MRRGRQRVEKQVLDLEGKPTGTVELDPALFSVPVKVHVLHQVVKAQMANYIKKTASTLRRSEVSGGGRKPWRQKGTGRARAGTIRSPIWRGGGVVFGPKPRHVEVKPPRSLRRLAFKMAWSDRFASDAVIIVDKMELPEIKTKYLLEKMVTIGASGRVLIALAKKDVVVSKSARNLKFRPRKFYAGQIKSVSVKPIDQVTVHDILLADRIVLTRESLDRLRARMECV